MTGLLLVAASGLAKEALAARAAEVAGTGTRSGGRDDSVVVLDDDRARWGERLCGHPVVGGTELVAEYPDHRVLVCVGAGPARRAVVRRLASLGVKTERYATLVHPDVRVPGGCEVGPGSIVLAGSVLTADVRVGTHVVVMPQVTLTHDVVVEDFATLCAGVSLGGGVRVGTGAYLGMNATVRQGLEVGADAVLGMGSVLLRDLPAGQTWAGVPAAELARRTSGTPR